MKKIFTVLLFIGILILVYVYSFITSFNYTSNIKWEIQESAIIKNKDNLQTTID